MPPAENALLQRRAGAARLPDARMLFHSDEHPAEGTLREMHEQSLALAGALRSLGLGPGGVVMRGHMGRILGLDV